jgi:hypothetical protein
VNECKYCGKEKCRNVSGLESVKKKRRLGGTCHVWDDNIKMDVKGIILIGLDLILLDLDRENRREFVKMAIKSWIL